MRLREQRRLPVHLLLPSQAPARGPGVLHQHRARGPSTSTTSGVTGAALPPMLPDTAGMEYVGLLQEYKGPAPARLPARPGSSPSTRASSAQAAQAQAMIRAALRGPDGSGDRGGFASAKPVEVIGRKTFKRSRTSNKGVRQARQGPVRHRSRATPTERLLRQPLAAT